MKWTVDKSCTNAVNSADYLRAKKELRTNYSALLLEFPLQEKDKSWEFPCIRFLISKESVRTC